MNLVSDLNPQQCEAVEHEGGPLLVLAGAGSGKTRVLTYRIAYLIRQRNRMPHQILAITFTNKAAEEMRHRVRRLLGSDFQGIWIGTFHATCARILRQHIERLGLQRNFVIYDETDQLRVIKASLKKHNVQDKRIRPAAIKAMLDKSKNYVLDPVDLIDPSSAFQDILPTIFSEYANVLREANALDFGDLILFVLHLFEHHHDIRDGYRQRFRSVLVDEYQDTNRVQHELLKRLVPPSGDLCVVGDDDQSIYRWRGAEVNNMLDFETDFPGTRVLTLEQNYRSTQRILEAAAAVARGNPKRHEKRLWTANEPGDPIGYREAGNLEEEAEFVAQEILSLVSRGEASYRDMGVFFRTNAQSRPFEERFVPFRIPYVVVGSLRFYERAEIKDLLAYLRFLYNPRDSVSLLRILNRPSRGIGAATQELLERRAAQVGLPLWEALEQALAGDIFSGAPKRKLKHFRDLILELQTGLDEGILLSRLLKNLLEQTGYKAYLQGQPDGERRLENAEELIRTAVNFEQTFDEVRGPQLLGDFCERIALITNTDTLESPTDCVSLMTLHCAKGLEFPIVFLVGMEDGMLPHQRACLLPEDLAEERRLCYVGMTRARKKLYLSRARTRTNYGEKRSTHPSPFLLSIPTELMVTLDEATQMETDSFTEHPKEQYTDSNPKEVPMSIDIPSLPPHRHTDKDRSFRVGDLVEHESLGKGTVRKVERHGEKEKIIVEFSGRKIRKLMADVAPIQKLTRKRPGS